MKTYLGVHSIGKVLRLCMIVIITIYTLGIKTDSVESLMAGEGLTWSVWLNAPVKLVVCWENPADADPLVSEGDQTSGAMRREWVRLAIKRTWERRARVIFVGWQQCQNEANALPPPESLGPRRPGTGDENLKVNISYTGASNNWGHGSWGDYQKSGVTLNLHCSNTSLKACIEALSIHEFGHTLGFYHEEERSDWPTNIPGCPRQTYPPSDPWWPVPTERLYGSPDAASVMAYCSNGPTNLSPKDISGVQRLYTRRQPGTLLSVPGSLCLSGHANNANGDVTFGWECDEANNDQEWRYDPEKHSLTIYWPSTPQKLRCLDVDTITNSKVQIWDCNNGANQQWTFRRVEIHGYGGLCLTRPNSGPGPVKMQPCSGSAAQLWQLLPGSPADTFQVKSETGDMCLMADAASGAAASVLSCNYGPKSYLPLLSKPALIFGGQQLGESPESDMALASKVRNFKLLSGGQIGISTGGQTSFCMDVKDVWDADFRAGHGGPAAGQTVQAFQCNGTQLNQFWNLSGDVVSGNKCLAVTGNHTANGSGTEVSTCNNSIEQNWDYYW